MCHITDASALPVLCGVATVTPFSSLMLQDEFGSTALIAACGENNLEVATVLLEGGAIVDYQNKVNIIYFNHIIMCCILFFTFDFTHREV